MLDSQGIRLDPDKVKAFQQMREPKNAKELIGNGKLLSKFMPNLADTTKSHHDLLVKNNHWTWTELSRQLLQKELKNS